MVDLSHLLGSVLNTVLALVHGTGSIPPILG
jgi:hypothetical protein